MNAPKKDMGMLRIKKSTGRILCFLMALAFASTGCRLISDSMPSKKTVSGPTGMASTVFEGLIFHDDFNDQLNSAWNWQNEAATNYRLRDDGWLEIRGQEENMLEGGQQINLLWTTLPEGSFEIATHLNIQPLFDFQRAGLLLYNDSQDYISLSRGYCMQCVLGGNGVFLEYNFGNTHGRFSDEVGASDLYLMLVVEGGVASAFYAVEPGKWQYLASLEYDNNFERVALIVVNSSTWESGYDTVGTFDYFDVQRPGQLLSTPTPGPLFEI